ncbi:MAG: hemerythrin domain-containing protein [Planctomycetaceae bacterium]|nr:hemerythrin domain-containing protein [Planctomycetaceae bacterium]
MPDTKVRALDAPALLEEDHSHFRDLFEGYQQLGDGPRPSKQELFELLRREMAVHAVLEEDIFYPAIEHANDRKARRAVEDARLEHRAVKSILAELGALTPDDAAFDLKMDVLRETVLHHGEEEEREMFRIFRHLPPEIREDVSDRLRSRKQELTSLFEPQ